MHFYPCNNANITKSHLGREGPGGIILGFLFYGCTLEAEGAATEDVGVREGTTTPLTRRKGLGAGFLFQRECTAVLEVEGGAPEGGSAKLIVGCAGTDGIEAEGGEDVPGRHLSGIVVAGEAAGGVVVLGGENVADNAAGLVVAPDVVIEVGNLVAGFVAVPIETLLEHGIEFFFEALRPTHCLNEGGNVVGHVEGVVAGGTLGDVAFAVGEVGVVFELTPYMPTIGPTCEGINDVAPVGGAAQELAVVVGRTEVAGELSHAEVVVGILQGARGLFVGVERVENVILHGYVAILQVRLQGAAALAVLIVSLRRRREGVLAEVAIGEPRPLPLGSKDALDVSIGKDGGTVVANHGGGVAVPAGEDGHPASAVGEGDERLHHLS